MLKGPSAAALYGTAAANGVLVITTKRGAAGSTRWTAYGEGGRVTQPADFFDNYRSWGRNVVNGTPQSAAVLCRISDQALGRCVVDSVTTFNPFMNPATRPFAATPRALVGLQASGGVQSFRFFASAEREDETGPFEMSQSEITRITTARGAAPREDQVHPNRLKQTALRGNFTVPFAKTATFDVSTGYIDRTLNTPFEGSFFQGLWNQVYFAPGYRTPTNGTAAQNLGDIYSRLAAAPRPARHWERGVQVGAALVARDARHRGPRPERELRLPLLARRARARTAAGAPPGSRAGATRRATPTAGTRWTSARRRAGGCSASSRRARRSARSVQGHAVRDGGAGLPAAAWRAEPERRGDEERLRAHTRERDVRRVRRGGARLGGRAVPDVRVRTDQNSAFGRSVGNTVYPAPR